MITLINLSNPISKRQAIEFYLNCFSGFNNEQKEHIIDRFDREFSDIKFLKCFNRQMTIKLKIFAPNMYQIKYES